MQEKKSLTSKLYRENGEPTDVKGSQRTAQRGQHGTVFVAPLAQRTLGLLRHLVRSETKKKNCQHSHCPCTLRNIRNYYRTSKKRYLIDGARFVL